MAAKKKINKTQFVKSLPKDMSAKDVVRKAKESGIVISEAYVYTIRSAASRAGKSSTAKGKSTATTAAKSAKKSATKTAHPASHTGAKKGATVHVAHAASSATKAGAHVAPAAKTVAHAAPAHKAPAHKVAKKTAKKAAHKTAHHPPAPPPKAAAHSVASGSSERRFVELVADIGMRRAEVLLEAFRGQVTHIRVG